MSQLRDMPDEARFEMDFHDPDGLAWADYVREGDTLAIPHVEAEAQLRGTGAAGRFMQALADHARAEHLRLRPICAYAVLWLKRHPDTHDIVDFKR